MPTISDWYEQWRKSHCSRHRLNAKEVRDFRDKVMADVDYPDKTYLLAGLTKLADALEEKSST